MPHWYSGHSRQDNSAHSQCNIQFCSHEMQRCALLNLSPVANPTHKHTLHCFPHGQASTGCSWSSHASGRRALAHNSEALYLPTFHKLSHTSQAHAPTQAPLSKCEQGNNYYKTNIHKKTASCMCNSLPLSWSWLLKILELHNKCSSNINNLQSKHKKSPK